MIETKKDIYNYKYIFGPVPSRRLGFSLGIDLVPFKTCSYDCIYCQLGKTTNKTITRKEYVPINQLIHELEQKLTEKVKIDYITLSGSGEPTLYLKLGDLINNIKQRTNIPIAVLTNSSLLWDDDVKNELKNADLIIPSLDAGNEDMFRYVNRPSKDLAFNKVIDGLVSFSNLYRGKIWLEVFLLNGATSIQSEILDLNDIIKKIQPARIQLNTVKRPPAESFAFTVPNEQMLELSKYFDGNVEVISDFSRQADENYMKTTKEEIINLLKRRPCSLDDIAGGLNRHKNEIIKCLDELLTNEKLIYHEHNHTPYYSIKKTTLHI
ncbi:MAG: radical SAM protein [Spirochaetales bacterium]|nr:radical SAM protein [Spirochaetales bacterium]